MPVLSHLTPNELERIVNYVSALGAESGLAVDQVERITHVLLMIGNHNRWSVDMMERLAQFYVNTRANEHMLQGGDGGADNIVALEPADRFLENHRVGLERRDSLTPPVEREPAIIHDGPPEYVREPAAPRRGIEVLRVEGSGIHYSIRLGSGDSTHFWVEVLVSFMVLRATAYGCIAGVIAAVIRVLVCTSFGWPYRPISAAITNTLLQLFNQVAADWVLIFVGLGGLRSFVIALVSVETLRLIIRASVHALFLLIGRAIARRVSKEAGSLWAKLVL